jgi:hypothetical protein
MEPVQLDFTVALTPSVRITQLLATLAAQYRAIHPALPSTAPLYLTAFDELLDPTLTWGDYAFDPSLDPQLRIVRGVMPAQSARDHFVATSCRTVRALVQKLQCKGV